VPELRGPSRSGSPAPRPGSANVSMWRASSIKHGPIGSWQEAW